MSTAVLPAPTPALPRVAPLASPKPHRWTCEEFYRISELPSIADRKIILIDGEILETAAPSPRASSSHGLAEEWLRSVFPAPRYWVRCQLGMNFGINTDPQPDVAVIEGSPRTVKNLPESALLVVEIADTSLAFDTREKASLYAAAGITDYWVLDVENRRLHVFRDPQPDLTRKYGAWYGSVQVFGESERIAPLAAPDRTLTAAEWLPDVTSVP